MTRSQWTAKEEEVLFGLVGEMPWSVAATTYMQWAKGKGLPKRTRRALDQHVFRNGYSTRSTGQWIDVPTISSLLDVSGETIRRRVRNGQLQSFREGTRHYVNRKRLKAFAAKFPDMFAGRSVDDLFALLDDRALAESYAAMPPRRRTCRETKVQCLETGKVYRSYAVAARARKVTRQAITRAVTNGRSSAGLRWKRAT